MSSATASATLPQPAATTALRSAGRRYALHRTAALLLPAAGLALLLGVLFQQWPQVRWLTGTAIVVVISLLLWQLWRLWQPNMAALARHLDRRFPSLEDSTGLLLRHPADLNLLGQLQQQRVGERLIALQATTPTLLPVDFRRPAALAGLALLLALGAYFVKPPDAASLNAAPAVAIHFPETESAKPNQPAPARITETHVQVMPPTYAQQAAYAAAQPSFRCAQGARVRWTVRVNRAVKAPPQLELGRQRVAMRPVPGQPLVYAAEQVLTASVLYHLRYAGQVSDDYAVEVQPDQDPVVQLQTPKPYTLVEFGARPQVAVRIALRDDYGLTRARLVATVAQGQGEAVKFREVATDLSGPLRGQPAQATLTHLLNLPRLGLTYGDEVYFYVQAWDNNRHATRSDTYLVQWEDTTVDDSSTDISLGVNVVPAYFRSQRQIIIDTEKLLAERRNLTPEAFAERGNTLGFDQKVLRLRYGKFLGEEFEKTLGETAGPAPADSAGAHHPGQTDEHDEHEHAAAPSSTSPTAATDALTEPYMHRHDDAETADFLEPAVKAKLRGVLSQMWEAELRLRTARPADARPYEYRALRLLKQVQQQTRAYVRKSGYEPPVLPEATLRLTGDLAGATAPRRQQQVAAPPTQPAVRDALRLLGTLQQHQAVRPADAVLLDRAGPAVAQAVLRQPGAYLGALRALRQLTADVRARRPPCAACLPMVEQALTAVLPVPPPAPTRPAGSNRLARRYFQELSR